MKARLGMIVAVVLSATMVGTPASASAAATQPCATIHLAYTPTHVPPRGGLGFSLDLTNCSTMDEHLHVGVKWTGPCPFMHPTPFDQDLGSGQGVGESADGFAPQCLGRYRVRIAVFYRGRLLDRDRGGFMVEGAR